MWCLCLLRAMSRCSWLSKRTRASPFLRPWELRHSATPPLTMLSPLKNLAMSWSEDCQGRPRARTTVLLSTTSVLLQIPDSSL
uniref:Uncharacterized protein n=1 Tax=Ixodes ricinus TaxID=34613 RepID=A0A6B0U2W6_IXORI